MGSQLALTLPRARVLFGKYSGSEVAVDGEEYLIMNEQDILGILG